MKTHTPTLLTSPDQSLAAIEDTSLEGVPVDVVVAGALAVDVACDFRPPRDLISSDQPQLHTSNPASIQQSLGGVGHNVATALHYLNSDVRLCSSVGGDIAGSTAIDMLAKRGLQISGIQKLSIASHTAQYVAVNDANKGLVLAMADMAILEDNLVDFDAHWQPHIDTGKPKWLVVDANWDSSTLRKWLQAAKAFKVKVAFEPVSVAKSRRIFPKDGTSLSTVPEHTISLATPNALELTSIHDAASAAGAFDQEDWWRVIDSIGLSSSGSQDKLVALTNRHLVDQGLPQQSIRLLPFIPCILTTLGDKGVLLTQLLRPNDKRLTLPDSAPYILSRSTNEDEVVGGVYMRLFSPLEIIPADEIVSVNGVGDTFLGIMLAGLIKERPKDIADLVNVAQRGSIMTLRSTKSINPDISRLASEL